MGEVAFAGLRLRVRPGVVMTPRPATERVVAAALARMDGVPVRVADAGTGTGAIAVALAAAKPKAAVWATDVNRRAVALARENAARHGVADRVRVLHGDLLDPVEGPFDLVVGNLPYLQAAEGGYDGEPPDAVYAPGDGLVHVRRLIDQAARELAGGGALVLQYRAQVLEAAKAELGALRAALSSPGS
ncbi:MAG TPA: HemK family protein methyltransferase [Gaiellaceae bacterium]|nr:HemK family protein methyltransferase [Gaiellaceae bacterium]